MTVSGNRDDDQAVPVATGVTQVRVARTPDELEEVLRIRDEVFVDEQALTDDARNDPDDRQSIHFIAELDGRVVGTGRLTMYGREAQVAWVAVRPQYRGKGIGKAVMEAIIDRSRLENAGYVILNAQTHALSFYRDLGFDPVGTTFHMGGIEHQVMVLRF